MRLWIGICALILFVLPCGIEAEPRLKMTPHEFKLDDGTTVAAELGELTVPENRASKSDRTIVIRFVRFKSTKPDQKIPIIYLAGGPGGSGIGAARGGRFSLFQAMREFGDVIAIDQRGVGMSEPDLECKETYAIPLDQPLDPAVAGKVLSAAAKKCFDRHRAAGIDLSAYNTRENAADLNDLRIALGASKMTLWGISYGTHLSMATMKYHGEFIDRAILAGVEPLDHTYKLPSDQQDLMKEIAQLAEKDPSVRSALPDLLKSVDALLKELEKNPKTVALTHPIAGKAANVVVGKFDLQTALADMLQGPDSFVGMVDFVARLEKGDWTSLALVAAGRRNGTVFSAMSIAMDCASGESPDWKKRIQSEASSTLLGDAINYPFPYVCEGLGISDLGEEFRAPLKSEVPVLLISGTLDGRTPVRNGESAAVTLKNAQHLVLDGAGHSDPLFLSSPKILDVMKAFMSGKTIPETKIKVDVPNLIAPRTIVEQPMDSLKRFTGKYQIAKDEFRKVIMAGSILYTQRGDGNPLPIRPMSENSFFYDGSGSWLTFDMDKDGKVVSMTVYQQGGKGTAKKVD